MGRFAATAAPRLLQGAVLLLSGCAFSQAMMVPGETQAERSLRVDILRSIDKMQNAFAPQCEWQVSDTRKIAEDDGTLREEWVVTSCGEDVVYSISMTPIPRAGTGLSIAKPEAFSDSAAI